MTKSNYLQRILPLWFTAVAILMFTSACRPRAKECTTMTACCKVLRGSQGVGNACSEKILDGIERPEACIKVLDSVQAMFENHGRPLPQDCIIKE